MQFERGVRYTVNTINPLYKPYNGFTGTISFVKDENVVKGESGETVLLSLATGGLFIPETDLTGE